MKFTGLSTLKDPAESTHAPRSNIVILLQSAAAGIYAVYRYLDTTIISACQSKPHWKQQGLRASKV
jgi:hypothetical protein